MIFFWNFPLQDVLYSNTYFISLLTVFPIDKQGVKYQQLNLTTNKTKKLGNEDVVDRGQPVSKTTRKT